MTLCACYETSGADYDAKARTWRCGRCGALNRREGGAAPSAVPLVSRALVLGRRGRPRVAVIDARGRCGFIRDASGSRLSVFAAAALWASRKVTPGVEGG